MSETPWQSIDSAPRDATAILLCRATDADGRPILDDAWGVFVQVAAWWSNGGAMPGEWVVYCSMVNDPALHFVPTHWMPLPANPLDTDTNS